MQSPSLTRVLARLRAAVQLARKRSDQSHILGSRLNLKRSAVSSFHSDSTRVSGARGEAQASGGLSRFSCEALVMRPASWAAPRAWPDDRARPSYGARNCAGVY